MSDELINKIKHLLSNDRIRFTSAEVEEIRKEVLAEIEALVSKPKPDEPKKVHLPVVQS